MREPWSPSDAALSRTALTAFMGDDWLASRIAGRCQVVGLEGRDWRLPVRVSFPSAASGRESGPGDGPGTRRGGTGR